MSEYRIGSYRVGPERDLAGGRVKMFPVYNLRGDLVAWAPNEEMAKEFANVLSGTEGGITDKSSQVGRWRRGSEVFIRLKESLKDLIG